MKLNLTHEIAVLRRLSNRELQSQFAELFGNDARTTKNRVWLIRRIAWRMQALAEGDLSERARQRAAELANDADLRLSPPRMKPTAPPPKPRTKRTPAPRGPRPIGCEPAPCWRVCTKAKRFTSRSCITASPSMAGFIHRSAPSPKPSADPIAAAIAFSA